MEDLELLINEEEDLKVIQENNLRLKSLLTWIKRKDPHRPLAGRRWNCTRWPPILPQDSLFNRFLRFFFLLLLSSTLIRTMRVMANIRWDSANNWHHHISWGEVAVRGVIVVVVAGAVFATEATKTMKTMMKRPFFSAPQKRVEVETICGLVRQV